MALIKVLVLMVSFAVVVHGQGGGGSSSPPTNTSSQQGQPAAKQADTGFPGAVDTDGPPSDSVLGAYHTEAVASDVADCSKLGEAILQKRGSAAEAAIVTSLCVGLYHPQSCGIGGGLFLVAYDKRGRNATVIDAREVAPSLAREMMFVNTTIDSQKGWHTAGVPGAIAGYWEAFQRFGSGKLQWADLFAPAIKLARDGVRVDSILAKNFAEVADDIRSYDKGFTQTFLNPKTRDIYVEGDILKYPAQAQTLQTVAQDKKGTFEFYQGKISVNFSNELWAGTGIISQKDMKNYRVQVKPALKLTLNDKSTVFGAPPPAGSLIVQYILNVMDGYGYNTPWSGMSDDDKILFYQRFTEAMKFAGARRAELGDEQFVPAVAKMKDTLLSKAFADQTRGKINEQQTSPDPQTYGTTAMSPVGFEGTCHVSVVDRNGNAVAVTSSLNLQFGSRRVSPSTGILVNSAMNDFTCYPDQQPFDGVPAATANNVAPGKRPLSSMSPIIVANSDGSVKMAIGGSGGSRIITSVVQAILRVLYFGQNIKEAIDAPRLHHQTLPMELDYEPGFVENHLAALQAKGHTLVLTDTDTFVVAQGIAQPASRPGGPQTGLEANCDYRGKGGPDGA